MGDLATDRAIELTEATDELSTESQEIHDMIEHITEHIEKCQLVYMDQEKKEITEISRHLNTLDKKMHRLMENLGELEKTD
jgi:prefoldin subunit 5